ncbi:MAG: hypothetical protein CMB64_03440 [Euryarchaeota archaeon]|nr:hypothetical protein [Euryarchaeota archaeon]
MNSQMTPRTVVPFIANKQLSADKDIECVTPKYPCAYTGYLFYSRNNYAASIFPSPWFAARKLKRSDMQRPRM